MQLADMNGDGRSDLVVYEAGSSSFRVGYGTASGDFANWSVWKFGIGRPTSWDVADVTGDGRPDVVSFEGWNHGSRPGGGSYMISTGSGQWKFTSLQGMDPDATMQLADMNGDGRSDLVVYEAGSSSFRVGYGTASGDFANWSVWKSGIGRPTSWDVADVTGS
jgi:hypothetical protein